MRIVLCTLFLFLFCTNSRGQQEAVRIERSMQLLSAMQNGQMQTVMHLFDSSVIKKLPVSSMNLLWNQLVKNSGIGNYVDTQGILASGNHVLIGLEFESDHMDFKCVFNEKDLIVGFFLVPYSDKTPYSLPSYAKPEKYTEISYTLINGEFRMPGKLCLPNGKGPFPLVILGHGSGPNSMDEEMGPNKVFRDIAYGLGSKGVAVFRYDKRTFQYGAEASIHPDSLTPWEECEHDLVVAADTFSKDPRIKPDAIFLFGHSLTGMLAPRIAQRSGKYAGIIIAGGPVRPMDSLLLDQFEYHNSLDTSGAWLRPLHDLKNEIEYLHSEDFNRDTDPSLLPLGINALYWIDLMSYNPVQVAQKLDIPILVLQAGDDFQVTTKEFELWKQGLKGRNVSFILYPGLGHGFFPSKGIKGPDQYEHQAPVEIQLIRDVVNFVKR